MGNFIKQYQKELEKEMMQFLFLCGKKDGTILIEHNAKDNLADIVRLAVIAITLDYKKVFLKIAASVQGHTSDLIKEFEKLNGNFALVDLWLNDFIENIEDGKARGIVGNFWRERKKTLDCENFSVDKLLCA